MDEIVFYSHKDPLVYLRDHLQNVSKEMVSIYRKQRHFLKIPIDEEFVALLGLAHDFGKYTSFFQRHLLNGEHDIKKRDQHSFISALFGAWLFRDSLYKSLVAYFVIRHHHGDLKNLEDDLDDIKNRENLNILKEQIKDIVTYKFVIEKEYGFEIGDFLEQSKNIWERLKRAKFEFIEFTSSERKLEIYFTILYLYSLLIDSDKKEAAHIKPLKRERLPAYILEKYRETKKWDSPTKDIDKLRNKIYLEVREEISSLERPFLISSLTAPTGIGKTYLNLEVALRFREIEEDIPRIIYSLPFVSIIEQTYGVFGDIFSETLREVYLRNKEKYLLKHHHLAPIEYKTEDGEKSVNEALLLIESWESEVIVTTFIQFLYSVIAFKNSFIKKFHNIVGAVIILDEIQSLNIEFWKLLDIVLRKLTQFFSCKIVLSTATKPILLEDAKELIPNVDFYFKPTELNRTRLVPKINEKKRVKDFIDYFIENIDPDINSYLIVLNTIKSSIEFYEGIKRLSSTYKIFYLSTNIVPLQRRIRINKIKKALQNRERIILVSTQVVEAGVDLDFQKVYRDIAPLDSIIQVAGRCNRNKNLNISDVEIHFLIDENTGRAFSKMVYGSTLIDISREILKTQIEESEFKTLIDLYFQKVKQNKSFERSDIILKDMENLCFSGGTNNIAQDFRVIEELPFYRDLFVEINKTAQRVYANFEKKVLRERDFSKRLESYQLLKRKFKDYIISVPAKFVISAQNIDIFPKIPLENLEEFYDKAGYGLKRTKTDDALVW